MRASVTLLGTIVAAVWLTGSGSAYWPSGQRWAAGSNVAMHLQQGASNGTLIDGSRDWNIVTEGALATWNPFLSSVSFRVVRDSTAGNGLRNNVNNVTWGDDVYGDPFGDAVAVARWRYSLPDNTTLEADVVFDRSRSWNSYRGNQRSASGGGTLYDLRRVALHEFGHVLGLNHPDEHGQSVTAIMNSRVSNTDSLQTDDTNGVRAIYGASVPPPPPPPSNRAPSVSASCSPCTVQAGQTAGLRATASDPDGDGLTYRWTAAQGSFSNTTASAPSWTAPGQPGNVTATVTVEDGRGGRATASVTLQVVPRDRLQAESALLAGQALVSPNSRYRLAYQPDGNLVLYDDVGRTVLFATGTGGLAGRTLLQGDGNLVVYNSQGLPLWATGTAGHANALLVLLNDGNLVLYRSDGRPIWSLAPTNGGAAGGTFRGSLVSTGATPFGGPPFCSYAITLSDVVATMTVAQSSVTQAQVSALATEAALNGCPFPPMPPGRHTYALAGASLSGRNLVINYQPAGANNPQASLVFNGSVAADGRTISGTLTWHRTGIQSPLDWRVSAQITLSLAP